MGISEALFHFLMLASALLTGLGFPPFLRGLLGRRGMVVLYKDFNSLEKVAEL